VVRQNDIPRGADRSSPARPAGAVKAGCWAARGAGWLEGRGRCARSWSAEIAWREFPWGFVAVPLVLHYGASHQIRIALHNDFWLFVSMTTDVQNHDRGGRLEKCAVCAAIVLPENSANRADANTVCRTCGMPAVEPEATSPNTILSRAMRGCFTSK
jgi:hypothetical protein